MSEPFLIEHKKDLPECDRLLSLLLEHEAISLKYTFIESGYIDKIINCLSEHAVLHFFWDKSVHIFRSISTKKILENKHEIYQCAIDFRTDANRLMRLMSETFGINLETLDGLRELKFVKSKKQRGQLDNEWKYYLHGAECRFESDKTGQVVEVIIITHPEFGYLDDYFFYNYMATTVKYKKLADFFDNDYKKVAKAIDILARREILTRKPEIDMSRNVIAL